MHYYFYPRSPCGERPGHRYPVSSCIFISIHALLAESDFRIFAYGRRITRISIHALLAESDGGPIMQLYIGTKFLSTLSLRRATPVESRSNILITSVSIHALLAESDRYSLRHSTPSGRFYPRSPCGERRSSLNSIRWNPNVSIHALLAESDVNPYKLTMIFGKFLSTLSLRRATLATWQSNYVRGSFYPRSPCGERLERVIKCLL